MLTRLTGLYAIVPTTLILTVSFLVLFVVRKIESGALKVFGYIVAALLWVSALLIFSSGIYTLATGKCPMQKMMMKKQGIICEKMMGKPMMEKGMSREMKR